MSQPTSGDKRNAEGERVAYDFREGLKLAQVHKKSSEELSKYLEENRLENLEKLVITEKYDGPTFMTEMESIRKQYPDEMDALAKSLQAIVLDPPKVKEKKKFSINTDINPDSQYFYKERSSRESLLDRVYSGGLYVVYGPRQSGKTTLLKEMARELRTSLKFVVGIMRVPVVPVNDFFATVAKKLSEDVNSSDEVRQVASRFSSDANLDFLSYLFRRDYGKGRRLILFWDEFDTAYNTPEMQQLCAGALREVRNAASSLPAYGAVMCFGTYNATLVNSHNSSPFAKDALLGPTNLDFTLDETRRLFRQYEREYEVTIHEDVIQIVHGITGGHTGLTNACGRVIQNYQEKDPALKDVTMDQWPEILVRTLDLIKTLPGPGQMIQSIFGDNAALIVLADLVIGDKIRQPFSKQAEDTLLNLGFAKEVDANLSMKSQLVKELTIYHVLRLDPIIPQRRFVIDEGSIDIAAFLTTVFRNFNASQVRGAHTWCYKSTPSGLHVPHEAPYQFQFGLTADRVLARSGWVLMNEANSNLGKPRMNDAKGKEKAKGENEPGKLDFLLQSERAKVGIELVASGTEADVREHASRSYPVALGLSQYVVVHIYEEKTPGSGITEAKGFAEEGKKTSRVPIFQVQHNKDFTQVKMTYRTKALGLFGQDKTEKIL